MITIGIDFDNTIVDYNAVFFKVANEEKLLPDDFSENKLFIRDYFRKTGKEDVWIEMQGYVYGCCMQDARLYPGVTRFSEMMAYSLKVAI